ncbi:MAG: hypothetical protein Q8761_03385, partial [Sweet potato little leaf phytoplasma]|nr:hypothetical protein [Sweet potato little leaf phytoplasma]
GQVIMYADNITDAMKIAIAETNRRRIIHKKTKGASLRIGLECKPTSQGEKSRGFRSVIT